MFTLFLARVVGESKIQSHTEMEVVSIRGTTMDAETIGTD